MTIAVVAEKPSVAADIAKTLGATKRGDGCIRGNGHVITWAIGHLVALAQPHEIQGEWKTWRRDLLPMFPRHWPLVVVDRTRKQFEIVKRIINNAEVEAVVSATDAGREGELIFRYIYEKAGCKKPVRRLWISSLTRDAIRKGFDTLQPGSAYDSLARAAIGRSRADWLVGMNLSRAYTLSSGDMWSVGRVQTPTLAMVVERTLAIGDFVPEPYLEVVADFRSDPRDGADETLSYKGAYTGSGATPKSARPARLPADGEEAARVEQRARAGTARIETINKEQKIHKPPLLFDLTELQRQANRLYGFSASKTLQIAQKLYEKHKLISYPRTGSRYLSKEVAKTIGPVVAAIRGPYEPLLDEGTGHRPLGKRYVNDDRVTDHHAIIPTGASSHGPPAGSDEGKIYDLVCRRLLGAWQKDHVLFVTTVLTSIRATCEGTGEQPSIDHYRSKGTVVHQLGWRILDVPFPAQKRKKAEDGEGEADQLLPAGLTRGQPQIVEDVAVLKKVTRPPKPHTDAALLTAMETAGKTLDDKELSSAMVETGLGTPATRAAIIETLLAREYVYRKGKTLWATQKGIDLIRTVHEHVKSPAMTGQWERRLGQISGGKGIWSGSSTTSRGLFGR